MSRASKVLLLWPQFVYWALVAAIPLEVWRLSTLYAMGIGCLRVETDCYVPGAEYLLEFTIAYLGAALVLWPLAAINVARLIRAPRTGEHDT
jgi:hypothetical protein